MIGGEKRKRKCVSLSRLSEFGGCPERIWTRHLSCHLSHFSLFFVSFFICPCRSSNASIEFSRGHHEGKGASEGDTTRLCVCMTSSLTLSQISKLRFVEMRRSTRQYSLTYGLRPTDRTRMLSSFTANTCNDQLFVSRCFRALIWALLKTVATTPGASIFTTAPNNSSAKTNWSQVTLEIFTAVTVKNSVFWDIKTQFVPHRSHVSGIEPRLLMLCKISGFYGGNCEECRLLGYKNPASTSQETHNVWATEPRLLMLCKVSGFHGSDYEECRLLGYKNAVRTSQETHYVSVTEPSQLMLCKISGFHGCDYEECRLLGCDAVWFL
jgi:hypothetical protein